MWKLAKDTIIKAFSGNRLPPEVFEMREYFALHDAITFRKEVQPDGTIVAISTDFHNGGITTSGADENALRENIQDAILTAFSVPAVYAKDVGLHQVGEHKVRHASAQ